MQPYLLKLGAWSIKTGLPVLLIIIAVLVLLRFLNLIIEKYFNKLIDTRKDPEFEKRANTLKFTLRSIINIVIIATGITIILAKLGIEIGPILATAGVLGIAVGFGAQRLIEDIISGFLILLDDQIRVGDVVQIGDKSGLVEKVDLKMVVLRDITGNVHYIRNGKIEMITNMTRDFSYYVFDIGVAYKENIDGVIAVLKQIDEEIRNDETFREDVLEPIEILGLDKFDESAVIIKARIKTKPIKQWAIGREFNLRLKKKFDDLNIEIPFPHRTVFVRTSDNKETNI